MDGTQHLAPVLVPQQLCALVAAAAARAAVSLNASADDTAYAVAQAILGIAADAARHGIVAPTATPAIPAPDVNFESSALTHPDIISSDASGHSDASAVTSTNASSHEIASTEQSSYASSELFDVSSNSLDASADANISVPTKSQRRRQRQRQRRTRQQTTVNVATPQHFNLSINDSDDDLQVNENQLEDGRTLSDPTPENQLEDGRTLSNPKPENQLEDGRALSDDNIRVNILRGDIYRKYFLDGLYIIPTSCSYFENRYQHNVISSFVSITYDDDSQVVPDEQLDPSRTFVDVPDEQLEPSRTLSDNNIHDHSIVPEKQLEPSRILSDAIRRYLDYKVGDEDARTLSDYSIPKENHENEYFESHESDEDSLDTTFSLDSRCVDLESPSAGTAPGATHDPDRGGARRPWVRPSIGTDAGAVPGAAAHSTAAPGATHDPDRGGARRPWIRPSSCSSAAALGAEPAGLRELVEQQVVVSASVAGTRSAPESRFKQMELDRLSIKLRTIQRNIELLAATCGHYNIQATIESLQSDFRGLM